jgi:tetratricopeptide (TPR) repeat protein
MYVDVYEARKANLGPEDPLTLTAEHNLAVVLRDMGQGPLADEMTRKTLDARMRTLGPNNEDTVASQMAVANGLYAQENFADAAAAYTQAIRVLENIPITPDSARQMLMGQANLAHSLVRAGKIHDGLELHKKVLASRKRQDAPEEHVLLTESNIGYAYFMLKKYDIALRKHKRVLRRRQAILGKTHPDTLFSMRAVAECEAALASAGVSPDVTRNPKPKESSQRPAPKTRHTKKKKRKNKR